MSQPFVVSFKIVGDSTSAVQATQAEDHALERLQATLVETTTAATASRRALDASLGGRGSDTASRAADIAAYGQQLDALRAKFNPIFAAEQRLAAAETEITRARRLGAISAEEASAAILRERSAYEALTQSIATNSNVRAQNTAHANDNSNLSTFNTANVAAQFQDIAVTSAMGMSPLQIALQQGTQLSAVLGTSGAAGAAATLRAALFSVISPMSLLTIAAVGFGAAAIQAFFAIISSGEDANETLEDHEKWLKQLLTGYDAAGAAAEDAMRRASTLPQGVVESDLGASLVDQEQKIAAARDRIAALVEDAQARARDMAGVAAQLGDGANWAPTPEEQAETERYAELLRLVSVGANSTQLELLQARVAAREFYNTTKDGSLRGAADEIYQYVGSLQQAQIEAFAAARALAVLQNQAAITDMGKATDTTVAAIERLKALAPDLRTEYQKAGDELRTALGASPDGTLRLAAQQQYDKTIAALDAQAAQRDAEKAARESQRLAKQQSDYDRLLGTTRERTAQLQIEAQVVGLSAEAADKLRIQLELENAARKDSIGLSPERVAEIEREAEAQARLTAQVERSQAAQDLYARTGESSIDRLVSALTTGSESIGDALMAIGRDWQQMLMQLAFSNPLKNLLFGGNNPTIFDSGGLLGDLFKGLGLPQNAAGTDNWRGGLTIANENGRGEIFDLPRGTRIYPHDVSMEMARAAGGARGGGNVLVEVHNYSGQPVRQERSRGADGTEIVRLIIGTVKQAIADGSMDGALNSTYGLKRRTS